MKNLEKNFKKVSKLVVILSIVGLATGCGSIADAGLEQAQNDPTTIETPETLQGTTNESDVDIQTRDEKPL